MFENIKPTDTTIEVALPFYIMSQISNIFYYANIKDKGLTMYDEKFGLALARKKPEIRSQYFKIQKTWHEKWITKYPDVPETDEYITHDKINKKLSYDFETYGYCKTNISEDDIWHLVETVVLLSHKKPDGHINVKVEFGEGEGKVPLDNIAKRAEEYKPKERVTYKMIKEYIEAKYGFKVHTAYIAEVKRDLGLPMYDAPNAVEELKQPRKHPTAEKVEAIKDALKHFEVI